MTYRKQQTKDPILELDNEGGQGRHLRQASTHIGWSTLKTLQYTCKHMICTHKYTNNYQEDAELSLIRVCIDKILSLLRPLIIRKPIRNSQLYFHHSDLSVAFHTCCFYSRSTSRFFFFFFTQISTIVILNVSELNRLVEMATFVLLN